jgi:hypothetical protein
MKTAVKVIGAIAAVLMILSASSCGLSLTPIDELIIAAKELKTVIPAIQAGVSLVKPHDPTERALTPDYLKSLGATTGNNWTFVHPNDTPEYVYNSVVGTGTKRFPPSGNYELTNMDQLYFTLTPESSLGATYYRLVLYTYPAIDLSVAYTVEEYIVNSVGAESWEWGNLNLARQRDSWVSLTTYYLDSTSGTRTIQWMSGTSGQYYPAFAVGTPDPLVPSSFVGYRNEDASTPPVKQTGGMSFSSWVTERVQGKKTLTDSTQYYTETDINHHSGLSYVFMDKKRKWSADTYITTRMEEDTSLGTKMIRSVGEVGTTQYYIDKVDRSLVNGKVSYTSSHDVYNTALPRDFDKKAKEYVFLDVLEDSAGAGTFTGTLKQTQGSTEYTHDVTIDRDTSFQYRVSMKYKSQGGRPKALPDAIAIPLTMTDLANLSIPLPGANATFNGFYESGILYGTLTSGSHAYDVVVADEGVAIDDRLYAY